jgi:uncharacterized protein YjaG (DUF416 family)
MQLEFPNIQITSSNWDILTELLSQLSLEHQILFAASICERILPIYTTIDFPENFNHKTLPILREVLDYIATAKAVKTARADNRQASPD